MKPKQFPKKHLGQHFLKDDNIARKIVASLPPEAGGIIEVGPGTGVLTRHIMALENKESWFIEADGSLVKELRALFPDLSDHFLHQDFLRSDIEKLVEGPVTIIGNFPYNISSQIFFKILGNRDQVISVVCMVQKEVAERIASPPGSKKYGILSVLLQAFYDIEYRFTVNETVFYPPPKVKSAVIRLRRNGVERLVCDEKIFFRVVKTAFNQRRKTLRNSLRSMDLDFDGSLKDFSGKRPEQLGISDFVRLAASAQDQK